MVGWMDEGVGGLMSEWRGNDCSACPAGQRAHPLIV